MANDKTTTQRTEIWSGLETISKKSFEVLSRARSTSDYCHDSKSPYSLVTNDQYFQMIKQLKAKGIRQRFITEITQENARYSKELANHVELRHLEGVKGNFGIVDGKEYGAAANIHDLQPPIEFIYSNVKTFVEQQQYFFETLWNKAIPAEKKIREIEEGRPPEQLEILEDTHKSIGRAFDIMKKTQKELLVLFATPRTFSFALQGESADIYRKISEKDVDIKVLVPRGPKSENDQIAKKVGEISPSINLRLSEADLNTRITIMISDRNEFMSWELKDDTLDDPYLAGGIATYSNIKALAGSYATIFDNLWKLAEFAENLRLANIKLENNEKAMREFINIAAHELRTPIQPILSLSEMLLPDTSTDPQQHRKLVEVIVRNAHKLENLAEEILDVTRIESGRLQLSMEKIDLYELLARVVSDFEAVIKSEFDKNENPNKAIIYLKDESLNDRAAEPNLERLLVLADANRIVQVITNLLSNAVKFSTQRDRALITITTGKRVIDSKSMATVSISDQGQGIDPEIVPRLFQKFISGSEKGTGLGLYISKNIVKAHGGDIWAENNKKGTGATFVFTLPLLKSQDG